MTGLATLVESGNIERESMETADSRDRVEREKHVDRERAGLATPVESGDMERKSMEIAGSRDRLEREKYVDMERAGLATFIESGDVGAGLATPAVDWIRKTATNEQQPP